MQIVGGNRDQIAKSNSEKHAIDFWSGWKKEHMKNNINKLQTNINGLSMFDHSAVYKELDDRYFYKLREYDTDNEKNKEEFLKEMHNFIDYAHDPCKIFKREA